MEIFEAIMTVTEAAIEIVFIELPLIFAGLFIGWMMCRMVRESWKKSREDFNYWE
jgi:hypothetical protein